MENQAAHANVTSVPGKKIYLAGPMRGYPGWNAAAFKDAEDRWILAGWQVFNPVAISKAMCYTEQSDNDRQHLEHVIHTDIACLFKSDAIGLLPGWEKSRGATVELALANFLSLKVYDALTMYPASVCPLPWYNGTQGDWQDVWREMIYGWSSSAK